MSQVSGTAPAWAAYPRGVGEPVIDPRVRGHVAAFNTAVRTGNWAEFTARFAESARMGLIGTPIGPWQGRSAIAQAYERQPPTDTMSVLDHRRDGAVDVVRFRWSRGGTGTIWLRWSDDLVAELDIAFDPEV